jgi:hypothetical protein
MEVSKIVVPFPKHSERRWGLSSLLNEGYHAGRNLSFEATLLYRQADHSPPTRAEVKEEWR